MVATARSPARPSAKADILSLDGHSGDVLAGEVQVEFERPVEALAKLAAWRVAVSTG